jgi:hypothetical protein
VKRNKINNKRKGKEIYNNPIQSLVLVTYISQGVVKQRNEQTCTARAHHVITTDRPIDTSH